MVITTNDALKRYDISSSAFALKKQIIIDAGGLVAKGRGGADPWLWKSSVIDKLALSGKLGNKMRKAVENAKHNKKETA